MNKLDMILKEVYISGVHEERQQLDFMTNFYSTKQKAKQAIEAYIAERVTQKLKYINHFDDSELRSVLERELRKARGE